MPIVNNMTNSFAIGKDAPLAKTTGYLPYNSSNYNIQIQYPPDWIKRTSNVYGKDVVDVVSFTFPFSEPFYHRLAYFMNVEPPTTYDSVTSIRGGSYYVKLQLQDNQTIKWIRSETEGFSNGYERTLDGQGNYRVNYTGKTYIPLNLNLSSISYPESYRITFSVSDIFYINHKRCILVDHTNWYDVPPPQYIISTSSSVELRPGEEKDIALYIKPTGKTSYNAIVYVAPLRIINDLNSPQILLDQSNTNSKVLLKEPGGATATLIMHLKAQENSNDILPVLYPINITTKITEISCCVYTDRLHF